MWQKARSIERFRNRRVSFEEKPSKSGKILVGLDIFLLYENGKYNFEQQAGLSLVVS